MFDGPRVKMLRTQRNISANTLAKAVGVSRSYISLIEIGSRIPTKETQKKLASFFECGVENLQLKESENVICRKSLYTESKFNKELISSDDAKEENKKTACGTDNFHIEIVFHLVKEALEQITRSAKAIKENVPSMSIVGKANPASNQGDYQLTSIREMVTLQINTVANGLAWFKQIRDCCRLPDVMLRSPPSMDETMKFIWFTEYASMHTRILLCTKWVSEDRLQEILNSELRAYM